MNQRLYDFLICKRPNIYGYDMFDVWTFDDNQLEHNHHYIQWLFPLKEKSDYDSLAPVIDNPEPYKIEIILDHMRTSLVVMCWFYGLDATWFSNQIGKISYEYDFAEKSKRWITPKNHNFKRITRIIKSLKLFGLDNEAKLFFDILTDIYNNHRDIIGKETYAYWKEAVEEK